MGKRKVKFRRLNWDAWYFNSILTGNGFVISEPSEVSLDGIKKKALYGPQSPLYGTSYEDEQSFIERYRCDCGEIKGRQFEGEECPFCHTKVTYKDSNINITGWIRFGPNNRLINPYYYNKLENTIGKTVFNDIIYAKYKITTNGNKERPKPEDFESKPSSPYHGIGIELFYKEFDNIMDYFKSLKKNKAHAFDILKKERSKVFVSHAPVLSNILRPQSSTESTFYYNTVDKMVNTMYTLSENLKNCNSIEKDYILQRIQTKLNMLWDEYLNLLNQKEGWIRSEILGGSLNYTSRNVIIPSPDLKDNEIDLSYQTFLEIFKYKIIYYLMKLDDIKLGKAYSIWKRATTFDPKVYEIMEYLIKHGDIKILINRNPTLIIIWCR